jgi:hypothetical protein
MMHDAYNVKSIYSSTMSYTSMMNRDARFSTLSGRFILGKEEKYPLYRMSGGS